MVESKVAKRCLKDFFSFGIFFSLAIVMWVESAMPARVQIATWGDCGQMGSLHLGMQSILAEAISF